MRVQASQHLTRGPQHRPAHAQNKNDPSGFAPETRSAELPALHWEGGTRVSDSDGTLPSRCSLAKQEKGAVLSYSRLTTVTVTKRARQRESRSLHCCFSLFSKHIRGLFLQLLQMIMGDMCPFLRMHTQTHACTNTCMWAHTCAHTHAHSHTHMSVSCPPCHRRGHSWEQGRLCPRPRYCTFQCVTKGAQCVFWVLSWLVPWPSPRDGTHPESHYWALLERGVFLQKIIKTFLGKTGR